MTLGIGAPTEPPRKYRNKPTTVDGIRFASKAEARRYGELKLLEKAGEISGLELQPRFDLRAPAGVMKFTKIGEYHADFSYYQRIDGCTRRVVEDVKSPATAKDKLFVWKRRHFEAEYGIKLKVIT